MNPFLQYILQLLYQRMGQGQQQPQQQQQQRGQVQQQQRMGRQAEANAGGTPQAQQARAWLMQNYLNPGYIGNDTSPGGGNVFGGFTRGTNADPRLNPQVGYAGFMQGGMPSMTRSGGQALDQMTGQPGQTSMNTWLSDIYGQQGVQGDPNERGLFGLPQNGDPIFGNSPRFDRNAGDSWSNFFNRGSSLQNIDDSIRGLNLGGGGNNELGSIWAV